MFDREGRGSALNRDHATEDLAGRGGATGSAGHEPKVAGLAAQHDGASGVPALAMRPHVDDLAFPERR